MVKLVFVVSAVAIRCIIIIARLRGLLCIVLSDRHYYIYVLHEWATLLRYGDVKESPRFARVARMTNDLFRATRIFIYA